MHACRAALGDDYWAVLEQMVVASLACGKPDVAAKCFEVLDAKFPGSTRVRRLYGLVLESRGDVRAMQLLCRSGCRLQLTRQCAVN
jgi:hypothetical protein